jgi:TetR/AcrR family transcriptional repressor of bet genes
MRAILSVYGAEVRGALMAAARPRARLEVTIRASFAPSNFRREVVSAWLNFYVMAATDPEARRLLTVYQRRCGRTSCTGCGRWRVRARPRSPSASRA